MEILVVAIAVLGMMTVAYLVAYTVPASVMRVVRRVKRKRGGTERSEGSDAHETYEIYVLVHAA